MGQAAIHERAPEESRGRPSPHSLLGIAIVIGVFAVNVYRARYQSITADEAFAWDLYIANPFHWILSVYGANNHVLQTLLSRLSVQALGLSELTLRLPSLAGGLLYLMFVYKLCRILFSNLLTFLLALAALTINPFIMDYLSAARGYGMALGFFMAGLYFAIRFFNDESKAGDARGVTLGCIALGLSISTTLAFLFPAIALAGIFTLLRLMDTHAATWRRRLLWSAGRVWLPLVGPTILFLSIPLAHAKRDDFYYGRDSLRDTALSLLGPSLFHQYGPWGPDTIPANIIRTVEIIMRWVVPVILALVLITLALVCRRWMKGRDFHRLGSLDRAYFLIGAVFAISLGMLVAAHYLAGLLYPLNRTGIYLVALLTLGCMLLIEYARNAPYLRPAIVILASAPAVIAIVFFLFGFTTSYYYEWRYDAGTKRIFHLLEAHNQFNTSEKVRVGANWRLNFSLNFYRQMYHADWLARVFRDPLLQAGNFDYYVLLPEDLEATRKLRLRVVYRDPISDQELAIPDTQPALSSKGRF